MTAAIQNDVPQNNVPQNAQPRAMGTVRLSAGWRRGQTRLSDLYQSGSGKALFPRRPETDLMAVLLNTAGGVTGGDRFAWSATAEDDADLTVTTQAAERAYRAQPGEIGHVDVTLSVGAGAKLRWLPQETILFEGAALRRRMTVDMAPDAQLLLAEPLILGRTAMGETLSQIQFNDQWRIRRDGRLVFADALNLSNAAPTHGNATLNGARAAASAVLIAPGAARLLAPLREILPKAERATAGASALGDDILALRMAAANGQELRRYLIPALERLSGRALPTVWKL